MPLVGGFLESVENTDLYTIINTIAMEVNKERVEMEKYGFIYVWFDKKHNRFYIGSHWGTEDDGYICSSSWMKQAYKHRPLDFKRRILETNIPDRKQTVDVENYWLKMINEDQLGKRYYNLRKHDFGHWSMDKDLSEKARQIMSKPRKNTNNMKGIPKSEEHKQKLREANVNQFKDPSQKELRRQKIAEQRANTDFSEKQRNSVIGRTPWNKGKKATSESIEKMKKSKSKNPWKHTEETKQKLREKNLGKTLSAEHREKIRQSLLKRNAA